MSSAESKAAARRGRAQGFADEGRGAVAKRPGQMLFKAGRVLVEQARDISRRKARRNVALPDEREPGGRPLRVGGVEAKRRSERVRRRVDLPKPLARFAEGEPRSGPVRRALQRLFENLRRRAKIALVPPRPWRRRSGARR